YFNKSVKDIISGILSDGGMTDFEFKVDDPGPVRKQTAQYNETNLHFITRLMEGEGWFYFFEHTADKHKLVIANANSGFTATDTELRPGTGIDNDILSDLHKPDIITHGKIGLRDYDHESPPKDLNVSENTVLAHAGAAKREVFHWPVLTYEVG